MLPLGRADATPGAKQAPNILQASHEVIWELMGAKKNLRKMEAAMTALENARIMYATKGGLENELAVKKAKEKLEIAFARVCYQTAVKAAYKASSESAKIEFRGNQRYLATSYTGTGLGIGSALLTMLTPTLAAAGLAAGPITGGVSAAVAVLILSLYVGYHLSPGPSKDGEAKAKRAIVALSKSLDVLSGDNVVSQKKRAGAYKTYLKERNAARFALPKEKAQAKKEAEAKLLVRLEQITQEDKVENLMSPRQNWEAYREHKTKVSRIENEAAEKGMSSEEVSDQVRQLEDQFQAEHKADFSAQNIANAWKIPMRIRMDAASCLLKGKVAQSHKRFINLTQHPSLKARFDKNKNERAIKGIREELRKNLRDMFNLELALHHMKPLIDGNDSSFETIARAAAAISAIEDEDMRSVFCGDAREQVEAANKAKKLTAGEADCYASISASVLGMGLNIASGAMSFDSNAAEATHPVHTAPHNPAPHNPDPGHSDYRFAAVLQAGSPLTTHMNVGDHSASPKARMPNVARITTEDAVVELRMDLTGDNRTHLGKDDEEVTASLDALIARLWNANSVPDKITLSMTRQAPDMAPPSSRPVSTETENITVDLRSTSAYHRVQYKNSLWNEKGKVIAGRAAIIGRHAFLSLASLPAQGVAQYNLKKTHAALNQATERSQSVRRALAADISPDLTLETDKQNLSNLP